MRRLLRNKRGGDLDPSSQVVKWLLLLLLFAVLVAVIMYIIKTNKGMERMTQCGGIAVAGKIGVCKPQNYPCSESVVGVGCTGSTPVCCFDEVPAVSVEQAQAFFKNNLKSNLDACKSDTTKCDDATKSIENILSPTDSQGRGKLFIVVHKLDSSATDFRMYEAGTFWGGNPEVKETVRYSGDTCVIRRKSGKEEILVEYGTGFRAGIGILAKGLRVFDAQLVDTSEEGMGAFIGLRHKVGNDASTPLCVIYSVD